MGAGCDIIVSTFLEVGKAESIVHKAVGEQRGLWSCATWSDMFALPKAAACMPRLHSVRSIPDAGVEPVV